MFLLLVYCMLELLLRVFGGRGSPCSVIQFFCVLSSFALLSLRERERERETERERDRERDRERET